MSSVPSWLIPRNMLLPTYRLSFDLPFAKKTGENGGITDRVVPSWQPVCILYRWRMRRLSFLNHLLTISSKKSYSGTFFSFFIFRFRCDIYRVPTNLFVGREGGSIVVAGVSVCRYKQWIVFYKFVWGGFIYPLLPDFCWELGEHPEGTKLGLGIQSQTFPSLLQ